MGRYFNTEGSCKPELHYMVNLDDRLQKIRQLYVDRGKYFVINRGRQYGKTTTLRALAEYLKEDYNILHMDFQRLGSSNFKNEANFVKAFSKAAQKALRGFQEEEREHLNGLFEDLTDSRDGNTLDELFLRISSMCETAEGPVVLIIDEVDAAANYQVFLDFLAMLRGYYLDRDNSPTFQSVILAGVYDIKNLKLKIRPEEEHQYNSPWNIAARFNMEFGFSAGQIAQMLQEYEEDRKTGMNIEEISECIYEYTSGYPYLVSVICKFQDEGIPEGLEGGAAAWTKEGIAEAVKLLMKENIPLFDSMMKQLDSYPELRDIIEQILYQGNEISFNLGVKSINLGSMFGFLKERNGYVAVANRIFEMYLLGKFITEESIKSEVYNRGQSDKSQFLCGGRLDMDKVLEKFVEYFTEIYGGSDERFIEKNGRRFFLLYLKPIINGTGNYYLEAQTRDARRTDVIVDYLGEQFVVEMKIWHGDEYNRRGERQLAEYLDYYHKEKGYILSFNFNQNKEPGIREIRIGTKTIVEAVV
ncbi:MAG: AAA-like domain-containing protein [Ruminococcus flavefaciens]|nr:AAA-like domain-containing protein [Ruminococcus flavefaciens]